LVLLRQVYRDGAGFLLDKVRAQTVAVTESSAEDIKNGALRSAIEKAFGITGGAT
jgi:hypothetical protein